MNLSYALDHQLLTKFSDFCVLRVTDGVRYFSTRAQKLCENRGGRPGLPVPKGPYGLCGRKATLNELLPAMLSHLAAAVSAFPLVVK